MSRNTSSSDGSTTRAGRGNAGGSQAPRRPSSGWTSGDRITACTAVPKMLVFSTSGIASSWRIASTGCDASHLENRPAREHLLQLGHGSERRQAAGVDDGDAVAVLRFVQVVRGDQHRRAAAGEVVDESPEPPPRQRIDAAGRLVEKDDRRLVQDGAAEPETLPPAARERAGQRRLAAAQARHVQHGRAARRQAIADRVRRCRRRTRCSDRRSASRRARSAATCSRCAASPPRAGCRRRCRPRAPSRTWDAAGRTACGSSSTCRRRCCRGSRRFLPGARRSSGR